MLYYMIVFLLYLKKQSDQLSNNAMAQSIANNNYKD